MPSDTLLEYLICILTVLVRIFAFFGTLSEFWNLTSMIMISWYHDISGLFIKTRTFEGVYLWLLYPALSVFLSYKGCLVGHCFYWEIYEMMSWGGITFHWEADQKDLLICCLYKKNYFLYRIVIKGKFPSSFLILISWIISLKEVHKSEYLSNLHITYIFLFSRMIANIQS